MYSLNCAGKLLTIDQPIVMGIINVTPDSFYQQSISNDIHNILGLAEKMINEGAAILDIGGQSTRPGAKMISEQEELQRVIPALEAINAQFPEAILSIDTFYASVVKEAVSKGASIVNDISGGRLDENMLSTVALLHVPYVCMHMLGTPATMQQNCIYEDMVKDILDFFIERIDACNKAGIIDVIVDPGFGFGKTIEQNFTLLKNLSVFKILDKPVLIGLSRKSTIYKTLGVTADEALNGTTVLNTIGLMNGAHILRVHDVKEAMEAIELINRYTNNY